MTQQEDFDMTRPDVLIVDGDATAQQCNPERAKPAHDWPPVLITRAAHRSRGRTPRRCCRGPQTAGAARCSCIRTRRRPDRGLTPGVQVSLDVLKPGEETVPVRHNSTQVNFCIRGRGTAVVGDRRIAFDQYDVWNHPSYVDLSPRQRFEGSARAPDVFERSAARNDARASRRGRPPTGPSEGSTPSIRRRMQLPTFQIGDDGAALMPYETLINPPAVASNVLHWPWQR